MALANSRQRAAAILRALDRAYPNARTALRYRTPFELLIATILSARATDESVNRVTPALFQRHPDAKALASASVTEVERIIRPTGFFRQKTKTIIACAKALVEMLGGALPRRMHDLARLPGVGRKTANVVLSSCWPRSRSDHGIAVDTHVRRVSQRLALTEEEDPDRIERDLMRLLPEEKWARFSYQLIELGRGPCTARNPRHETCPLLPWCPTGQAAAPIRATRTGTRPG
jgi:endonuclease-3